MGKATAAKHMDPFCYYCDRDFADEKVLIQHQRAKHFKCPDCGKRLNTATALSLHFLSVHKRELTVVPYSLEDRCKTDLEIHGMEGIPFTLIEKRAKEKGLELPLGYVEPERPQIKKRKLTKSPYMQYYAQYYQYPQQIVTPTHEVEEQPVEGIKEAIKEEQVPVVKKEYPLATISYELPKLPANAILTIVTPESIYEDVKYRSFKGI